MNAKEILKKGFEACGLNPWNTNASDYNEVFKRVQSSSNEVVSDSQLSPY